MDENLSKAQQKALELLKSNCNVFITGEAGTGKSYLLNYYTKNYCFNKAIIKCCFTAFAANNLEKDKENDLLGTIHSIFKITTPNIIAKHKWIKRTVAKAIAKYDIVIIDEISMVRIDLFEYVIKVINKANKYRNNPIQLIVVGDFFQLPPIITENEKKILHKLYHTIDGFAFESQWWNKLCLKLINLDHNFRQINNSTYLKYLQCIRTNNNLSQALTYFNQAINNTKLLTNNDSIGIYPTNKQVEKRNKVCLNKLKTKAISIHAYYDNDILHDIKKHKLTNNNLPCSIILYLKPNALVMLTKNDKIVKEQKQRFVNGDLATIISCAEEEVVIKLLKNNKLVHLHKYNCIHQIYKPVKYKFGFLSQDEYIGLYKQYPLKLAYGLTIHKAQGKTLKNILFDPKANKSFALTYGQIYTALSRIKSIENLYLLNKLTIDQIKANKKVIKFYKTIKN